MVEIHIAHFRMKGVGETFNLRRMYQDLRYWLIGEEWATPSTTSFPEKYVYQEETQKRGKETWIWWRFEKRYGTGKSIGTFTSSGRFIKNLKITIHPYKYNDVETVVNGKKIKVQKGTIEFIIHMTLQYGFEEWDTDETPFLKGISGAIWKRIYKKTVDMHKKNTLDEAYKLQAYLKRILEIESWSPAEREFYPVFGIPNTEF